MYNNIPQELRDLNQWVLWRYEMVDGRQTKVPYSTKGYKASIQNPSTWSSFDEVMKAGPALQASGIGLVLTANDPYSGIDIDNKPENPASPDELRVHQKILEAFPSYTERSVGGHGYHIIVRGKVPRGSDRGHVGIYSVDRYLTFTGQVVRDAPILDCQEMLDILYREMQPQQTVELQDAEELLDDREIVDMAMNATNADKFNELCIGDWQSMGYNSQSEADFALLSIIAFYTRNNEQVRRIFRMSNLGKREKAIRDNKYLDFALTKIRAQQPSPIDFSQLQANAAAIMEQQALPVTEVHHSEPPEEFPITLPPGLVGELAQYIYQASTLPVPEMSLVAAIGLMSGICGRSYNISNTGLNQYIILLAGTGTGKEGVRKGIDVVIANLRPQLPMIDEYLGPGIFASGQALLKTISERPCFVSVLGEFGLTLQEISDRRANSAQLMLKKTLLDLYNKSGWTDVMQSMVYSDAEKNTKSVMAPNLTIIGESNPATFFESLSTTQISEGLIPRFLFVEYSGDQVKRNKNPLRQLPTGLKQRLNDFVVASISIGNQNTACAVAHDPAAEKIQEAFEEKCRIAVNSKTDDVSKQIWNRANVKVLKLSALVAVGCNPHRPVITPEMTTWAIQIVEADCYRMTRRFESGDVGQGDSKQLNDLIHAVESYLKHPSPSVKSRFGALQVCGIVPYAYLLQRTASATSFKNDKNGATAALKKSLQAMVDSGMLVEVSKADLANKYKFSGVAYGIGAHWK